MPLPPASPREQFQLQERGVQLRPVATAPMAAPGYVTIYVQKNAGTGKHQVLAQHPTGVPQVISTEP